MPYKYLLEQLDLVLGTYLKYTGIEYQPISFEYWSSSNYMIVISGYT